MRAKYDVELVGDFVQTRTQLAELLLALTELPAPDEIHPEVRHDGVDDQKLEGLLGHLRRERNERVGHHLVRERSRDENVVEHHRGFQIETLSHLDDALAFERAFGVDPGYLGATATHVQGELGGHCQGVADLGLTAPPFAVDLGDAARGNAASEDGVDGIRAGLDVDGILSLRRKE